MRTLLFLLGCAAAAEVDLIARLEKTLDSCPSGFETATVSVCDVAQLTQPRPELLRRWTDSIQALQTHLNCTIQSLMVIQKAGDDQDAHLIDVLVRDILLLDESASCRLVTGVLLSQTSSSATFAFASAASEGRGRRLLDCPGTPAFLSAALSAVPSRRFVRRMNASMDWLAGALKSGPGQPCQLPATLNHKDDDSWHNFYTFSRHTKEVIAGAILAALGICGACMCTVCALLLSRGSDVFSRRREAAAKKSAAKAASLAAPRYSVGDAHCQVLLDPGTPDPPPPFSAQPPASIHIPVPAPPQRSRGDGEGRSLISPS